MVYSRLRRLVRPITLYAGALLIAAALVASTRTTAKMHKPLRPAAAENASGYHLLKSISIPGATGWDYLKYQPATHRLFITHGDHVVVVNVESEKIVANIGGMEGIHGVVLAPELNRGFVTDGRAAKLWIFNLKTLKVIGSAPTDKDADGDVYDPYSKRVFTFNGGSHTATVVDAKTGKTLGTIQLGGDPEFPVTDGHGHIYDNLESKSEIIEINPMTMKITHRWPLAPGEHPSGLAIDVEHHILFSGCHNNMMVMMNALNGKVLGTEPIGPGVDATRFDPRTQDAFATTGGDGMLTIIHEDSPTKFHVVANVPTEKGARTMALDPTTGDIFTVTAKIEEIPNLPPNTPWYKRRRIVPGSFHLLIYGK